MKVRFLSSARSELREAVRWYNGKRSGLGREFNDEVKKATESIAQFPDAWPPVLAKRQTVSVECSLAEALARNRRRVDKESHPISQPGIEGLI